MMVRSESSPLTLESNALAIRDIVAARDIPQRVTLIAFPPPSVIGNYSQENRNITAVHPAPVEAAMTPSSFPPASLPPPTKSSDDDKSGDTAGGITRNIAGNMGMGQASPLRLAWQEQLQASESPQHTMRDEVQSMSHLEENAAIALPSIDPEASAVTPVMNTIATLP
jgi:hypothetical protein